MTYYGIRVEIDHDINTGVATGWVQVIVTKGDMVVLEYMHMPDIDLLKDAVAFIKRDILPNQPYKPTAQEIKDVRVATGVNVRIAQEALYETGGDVVAAIEWIRPKGFYE